MLGPFLRWHARPARGRELVDVEARLGRRCRRAPGAHPAAGAVDRLERDGDGRLVVVDLKTGAARRPRTIGARAARRLPGGGRRGRVRRARRCPAARALVQLGTGAGAKEQHQEPLPGRRADADDWAGELVPRSATGMGGATFEARRARTAALPGPAQLPAAGARPAGDRMSVAQTLLRRPRRSEPRPAGDRGRRGGADGDRPRWPAGAAVALRLRAVAGAGAGGRRAARTGRSSSPAPAPARPRRWPPGCSGWSPTGWSSPEAILGLTFTRKAASELAERVRLRLAPLRAFPDTDGPAGDPALAGSRPSPPTTGTPPRWSPSTALRIGVEPGAGCSTGDVLAAGPTVVRTYDLDVPAGHRRATVTDVLALAGELGEHDVEPDELRRWTDELRTRDRRPRRTPPAAAAAAVRGGRAGARAAAARVALLPLVEAFEARKRTPGPSTTPTRWPTPPGSPTGFAEVGRRERARWRWCCSTSTRTPASGSCACCEALFGGPATRCSPSATRASPSTAGAAPPRATDHASPRTSRAGPATRRRRLTAGHQLAQRRARPRRRQRAVGASSAAAVPDLGAGPRGEPGAVRAALLETVAEETDGSPTGWRPVAGGRGRPASGRRRPHRRGAVPAAGAVRPGSRRALRERGVPVEVVGLGGLLAMPEVSDVVATLPVLVDPTAGDALGRLLTGARWRIGGRATSPRSAAGPGALAPAGRRGGRGRDPRHRRRSASIVEALDDLGPPEPTPPTGYRRLSAGWPPSWPRCAGGPGEPLPDLVDEVARTLRPGDRAGQRARTRARPAPAPTSTRCTASRRSSPSCAELPSLPAFLAYLRDAEDASAAWSRARSRSTRRRSSCSPGTRPRAWSGTSSPSPG